MTEIDFAILEEPETLSMNKLLATSTAQVTTDFNGQAAYFLLTASTSLGFLTSIVKEGGSNIFVVPTSNKPSHARKLSVADIIVTDHTIAIEMAALNAFIAQHGRTLAMGEAILCDVTSSSNPRISLAGNIRLA